MTVELLYFDHNIFLNKKQRYDLYEGKIVIAKGVFACMKDSEKFKETNDLYLKTACYKLVPRKNVFKIIKKSLKGFNVYLVKNDLKSNFLEKIKNYFSVEGNQKEVIKNILDIKDGGIEQIYLQYQEYKNKINVNHKILIQKETTS
jgi:hypothetical protein